MMLFEPSIRGGSFHHVRVVRPAHPVIHRVVVDPLAVERGDVCVQSTIWIFALELGSLSMTS
jgi:hypothetical protein